MKKIFYFILSIWTVCLHECLGTAVYVWYPRRSEKECLELELQMFVSCHMGSGNQILVLWKSSWALDY